MKINRDWFIRRFYDFRHGHSMYLSFILSFFNFILLNYRLLIQNVDVLQQVFSHLWMFALTFALTYPPLAIIIGYRFYRKKQLATDQEITLRENPFLFKMKPGREALLDIPRAILWSEIWLRYWKQINLITPEEEAELREYIEKYRRLLRGETLKP